MRRNNVFLAIAVAFGLMLAGCDSGLTGSDSSAEGESAAAQRKGFHAPRGHRLKITAVHEDDQRRFELSDHKIPAGWTTIELANRTQATHFAFLRKASEAFLAGLKDDEGEVSAEALIDAAVVPFQEAWDPYYQGDIGVGTFFANLGAKVPPWFFKHRPNGGPGLTSGGMNSRTTQNLEPGVYFVECYVLGENGQFHTLGMVEKFEVTEESSGAPEPRPTHSVTLTDDGIEVENDHIWPGPHTVAVTFEENGTPSGHDLHLIRLDHGTTVAEVNAWMDWPDIGPDFFYNTDKFGPALTSYHGAPGPQTWLGGVQDIRPPLPETAYFHVILMPGKYAWVAELPNPKPRDFLKTFTVPGRLPFGQDALGRPGS